MPYIYQADLWCDSCGQAVCKRLRHDGHAPTNPNDEYSYDSDEFPKFVGDPGEADCPQHCGGGDECLEAVELSTGRKIGALLSAALTSEGIWYVEEAIRDGGEVADFWAEAFGYCL